MAGLLVAGNLLWFRMMRTIWKKGFSMTFLNSLQDLRSFRALIEDSVTRTERVRLVAALAMLYCFLAAVAVSLFVLS